MRRNWLVVLGAVALSVLARLAGGQTAPASSQPLRIVISGVEGIVQVRDSADKPWRRAEVGQVVDTGAEFRTGPRSAVRCQIPPDQTITIDRLGTMKVLAAIEQSGKVKTDLLMQYGRTRYDIEQAGIEHESTIRSPNGALALRGTKVSFYDQPPFVPQAISLTGRAVYSNAKRQIAFGAKGQGKTAVSEENASAAESGAKAARIQSVIDPRGTVAMTQAEAEQAALEISRGGIQFGRLIIGGFEPPPTDLAAAGLLPGKLNFVATWTGFADIDLFVIVNPNTPGQKILGNPSVSKLFPDQVVQKLPSGATIPFDKVSTQKGDYEIAYWPKTNYKPGVFGIGIIHQDFRSLDPKYDAVSDVKLEVYQNGKKLDSVIVNPEEVRNNDAAIEFGTTYETQTNLNTGRDVVSTLAVVPDPNAGKRAAKAVKAAEIAVPSAKAGGRR